MSSDEQYKLATKDLLKKQCEMCINYRVGSNDNSYDGVCHKHAPVWVPYHETRPNSFCSRYPGVYKKDVCNDFELNGEKLKIKIEEASRQYASYMLCSACEEEKSMACHAQEYPYEKCAYYKAIWKMFSEDKEEK